jgi:regulator of replication initiation timing
MISSPEDRKKVFDCLKELDASMLRAAAEKDFQKEAIERLTEEVQIDKKHVKNMARIYHKQNFTAVQQDNEDLVALYEEIVGA